MIQISKVPEDTAFVFTVLFPVWLHDSKLSSLTDTDTELRLGRLKKISQLFTSKIHTYLSFLEFHIYPFQVSQIVKNKINSLKKYVNSSVI